MVHSQHLSAPRSYPSVIPSSCTNFSYTGKEVLQFAKITSWLVILTCSSTSTPGPSSLPVAEMILAAIFFAINMCDLQIKIETINWPWSDFFQTLTVTILYLITSTVVLTERGNQLPNRHRGTGPNRYLPLWL
ncbi:unnamed protein product [Gulo gulo]|uniref:MARVEL domain-containing protein n=1 Tax=Gulo gulo TaxID=48420 RepID=A0A9X9Q279_GULGU|nr:unnamed protein product [Gulo gulo]